MQVYQFDISYPVNYELTGKFEAPSENWIHEDFPLIDFELFVVTQGTLYISYKQTKYTVNEGEYLLLPPSPPPDNRRKGYKPSNCSFYWLHFSYKEDIQLTDLSNLDIQNLCLGKHLILQTQKTLTHPGKVIVLMKQLQDFIRSGYNGISLNYMATTILCEISNQVVIKEVNSVISNYKKKQTYNDIVDYIRRNSNVNLKVSDISDHFGYNEKYLSHLFGSVSGITLKQYILQSKMEVANYLLTDTNQPISEISITLGFNDSHNFMKAYKKITGLTPSEYRNAYSQRLLYHK